MKKLTKKDMRRGKGWDTTKVILMVIGNVNKSTEKTIIVYTEEDNIITDFGLQKSIYIIA